MNNAKIDSRPNLKMASPRACVAFSALDGVSGAFAFWRRLLRQMQGKGRAGIHHESGTAARVITNERPG
jgi:hypothetical protein